MPFHLPNFFFSFLSCSDVGGHTPLHLACINHQVPVVRWITREYPECAALVDYHRREPLHVCVGTRSEGDFELMRSVKCATLLLEV